MYTFAARSRNDLYDNEKKKSIKKEKKFSELKTSPLNNDFLELLYEIKRFAALVWVPSAKCRLVVLQVTFQVVRGLRYSNRCLQWYEYQWGLLWSRRSRILARYPLLPLFKYPRDTVSLFLFLGRLPWRFRLEQRMSEYEWRVSWPEVAIATSLCLSVSKLGHERGEIIPYTIV